jgi:hypothetical protein
LRTTQTARISFGRRLFECDFVYLTGEN